MAAQMATQMAATNRQPRRRSRSVVAVLVGFLVGAVLSIGTDAVLHAMGIFPALGQPMSDNLFLLATAYRLVYSIIACYIIARLAPDRPMQHALLGGAIGVVLSMVGAVATWNRGPAFGPHWYPVALIVTAIPCAWLGGKLRSMQIQSMAA